MLKAAILEAFGEAIEWNDADSIIDEFYDTRNEVADSIRYFLNDRRSPATAWLEAATWTACAAPSTVVADGDLITLGFDGSVNDDSTALVGCRVSDGHLFLIKCWERPADPALKEWRVDTADVDVTVAVTMKRYKVVGMYADPPHWQDYITRWQAAYGLRMRVKATQGHPLEWWTQRPVQMVRALERLHDAVALCEVTHDGSTTLTRHVRNARRRLAGKVGITIGKEHPKSRRKIDAAMAATLAYECRADAVAKGLGRSRKRKATAF
jgi:hypothetical protein